MDTAFVWDLGRNFIFFFLLPVTAAAIPTFETVTNEQLDLDAVVRCKEFWFLWFTYTTLALVVVLGLTTSNKLELSFLGFMGVFLGFPMLLQSRMFSYHDRNSGAQTSVGFELVLRLANPAFMQGLKRSINEQISKMQTQWLKLDPHKLGGVVTDYLTTQASLDKADGIQSFTSALIADVTANPQHKDSNLRTLFLQVKDAGGPRGIRFVISQARK